MLIDSHCHFDKFVQKRELDSVLERAREADVTHMVTIGTQPEDWPLYHKLATDYTQISWTAGLHPCNVEEDFRDALAQLSPCWTNPTLPVALGEIGLDYFRLPKDEVEAAKVKQWQADAFRFQLDLAHQLDCPVVVHSRAAFDDCLAMIDASGFPWQRIVFHCFVEGAEEVRRLNARGGRASFTGIVTFKNGESIRQAVVEQGIGTIMVETDSPYLAPEPHRGQVCEPAMIKLTAEKCASLLGVSFEELASKSTANAKAFYGLELD